MKKKILLLLILFAPLFVHALSLSDIRNQIRLIIKDNDSSRRRYTDDNINFLINEGQRDVENLTWLLSKNTTITLVSGTTYYSLPTGVVEIARVDKDYQLLDEVSVDKLDSDNNGSKWQNQGGVPLKYFQDSTRIDSLGFYPYPSGTASTGTVHVYYVRKPTDLSADSDIPFESIDRYLSYNDLLVYYPCIRIFMIEGDVNKATFYSQIYETRIQALKEKAGSTPNFIPSFSGTRSGK